MPSTVPKLNSRSVIRNASRRLDSMDNFLDGMNVIMKFAHAKDFEILRYGRQIVTLMEIACITLRWNVGVCLLVLCREEHVPHKSVYFKALVWMKRRRAAFPVYMDDRITTLLAPIEHKIVLRCKGIDPRTQLGIPELLINRKGRGASFIPSKAVCSQISNESPKL